jgi:DNA-binding MarR family transcriptional regulator
MMNRKKHVEELMDAAQFLKRRASGMSLFKGGRITPSEWLVVGYISHNEGANTNETATALNMSGSAVTQLVNSLVAKRYLARRQDPDDRRVQQLVLSSKSKARVSEFKKKHIQMMLKMFEALTDTEFERYVALNKKILKSLSTKTI